MLFIRFCYRDCNDFKSEGIIGQVRDALASIVRKFTQTLTRDDDIALSRGLRQLKKKRSIILSTHRLKIN